MRDTLMLIGNGLAMDYRQHVPEMPDPSHPLDFPLATPGTEAEPLRNTFWELWETVEAIRARQPE